MKKSYSPGVIQQKSSSLHDTKENIRIEQLIPSEILEDQGQLQKFLEAYYTFMNMDEFIYQENETFTGVVLEEKVTFRIPDPENKNNKFFTDETGADSSLVVTSPAGVDTTISLDAINVAITNGNELPGTLANLTSEVGKTFTVSGLSSSNNFTAKLITPVKNWVGPGPSFVMNTIEEAMNIDENASDYLELMQKEIAAAIPRNVTVNKRTLYKQILDFYKLRGSSDSIEIFFQILFNDDVEVAFPFDETLIPSSGNWSQPPAVTSVVNGAVSNSTAITVQTADVNIKLGSVFIGGTVKRVDNVTVAAVNGTSVTLDTAVSLSNGASITFEPRGTYLDNKGFLSYNIKIQDSLRFQKFSYLIKTGKNLSDWEGVFDRLVHPAGFIYFAEILLFLQLTDNVLTAAKNKASLPGTQPGVIGVEDIPLLVEMFASEFLPGVEAKIAKNGLLSIDLKDGIINVINMTNGGSGYTSVPTITTADGAAASGFTAASLTPVLTAGSVSSVTIVNGGKDYGIPQVTFAAPADITFNGSSSSIVNVGNNTIQLTGAQQAAFPVGATLTYSTTGGAIGGLTSGAQFRVHTSGSNLIKLKPLANQANPEVEINITSVGTGTTHKFTGVTATATATSLNGALEKITISDVGFGYAANATLSVSFNGQGSGSTQDPVATIGTTADGILDVDNINITGEGFGFDQLFGSVGTPAVAIGKVAAVTFNGRANKQYKTAPVIVFPEPQSKDSQGNLLVSNVTATAEFTIQAEDDLSDPNNQKYKGEITGVNITNAGNGYIDDPKVTISSSVQNEERVAEMLHTRPVECNHVTLADGEQLITTQINPRQATGSIMTSTGTAVKFLPEHTVNIVNASYGIIENNGYRQRRGPSNFFNTPRLFNSNQTIEFLGSNQIQNLDSTDINKYNTNSFVDIE